MSPWDVIGWLIVVAMSLFIGLLVSATLVAIVKRIVRPRKTIANRDNVTPLRWK